MDWKVKRIYIERLSSDNFKYGYSLQHIFLNNINKNTVKTIELRKFMNAIGY